MSLTPEERKLMDQRTTLTKAEHDVLVTSLAALNRAGRNWQLPLAGDDRAAKVEAALIGYLIDSRQSVPPTVTVPELDHDKMMAERFGSTIGPEQRRERRIVAHLCAHLIAKGFRIHGLFDSEEWTYFKDEADPVKAAMELIFNLDEASLRIGGGKVKPNGEPEYEHGILLIIGNGNMGNDMIADWTYDRADRDGFNAAMDEFDVEQVP